MVEKVIKKRKVMKSDFEDLAGELKQEYSRRQDTKWRKDHERIWKEVDRQVAMKPETPIINTGNPEEDWEAAIEMGSLADASEILADDVVRIAFPNDRSWYKPHVDLEPNLSFDEETGELQPRERQKLQDRADQLLQSLMSQQHKDFALKPRVKLSIKECLHHGGAVAEIRWETQNRFYDSSKSAQIGCGVWVPHSMWNCYPDDSEHIIGVNTAYEGSMFIEFEMPLHIALQQNWMNKDVMVQDKEAKKKNSVKLLKYYGDVYFKRSADRGIYVPNQVVIMDRLGRAIYNIEEVPVSHTPILYFGWERDDVRDCYYTSPLIKRSPTQKLTSHTAGKYSDAVDLAVAPPFTYDGNEPAYRRNGPRIAPHEAIAVKAGGKAEPLFVPDPTPMLQALTFFKQEVEEGTGVDAIRKGTTASTERTAFEVAKLDQKSEIRTIDFVNTLEEQGLRPYLYLQHDWNKRELKSYGFYNTEMNTPDFIVASASDIRKEAENVHFDIVGSAGQLGEENRKRNFVEVSLQLSSNELYARHLNTEEIVKQIYRDGGEKQPERFMITEETQDPQIAIIQAQAEEAIAQLQQEIEAMRQKAMKADEIPLIQQQHKTQLETHKNRIQALQDEIKLLEEQKQLLNERDRAEKRLESLKDEVNATVAETRIREAEQKSNDSEAKVKDTEKRSAEVEASMNEMIAILTKEIEERQAIKDKVIGFLQANGSEEVQNFVNQFDEEPSEEIEES